MRRLFLACFASVLLATPPAADDCVGCHDKIDLQAFRKRTHGGLACVQCHTAIKEIPHPEKLPVVQCVRCHRHEAEDYANSVHGAAQRKGKGHAATCRSCHGPAHGIVPRSNPASQVTRKNMQATCGKCHPQDFLGKLATHLSSRASRMDVKPLPK